MRYRLFLILFLVLFATTPGAAAAEKSRYRVELIVLTHLGHDEQPREALHLEDYSAALDFLTPPAETETPGASPTETLAAADTKTGEPEEGSAVPDAETDPWNVVSHVPELGERMQDAWRRPVQIRTPGANGEFELVSLGSDGKPGGESTAADIVKP